MKITSIGARHYEWERGHYHWRDGIMPRDHLIRVEE